MRWTEERKVAQGKRMRKMWKEGVFKNTGKRQNKKKKKVRRSSREVPIESILYKVLEAVIERKVRSILKEMFQ